MSVDEYLNTINRMEPDITPVDLAAAAASQAISLKRIADALDKQNTILYEMSLTGIMNTLPR